MLKIALAQINPTIADIDGNVRLMLEAAESAHAQGAEMVVFPELSLCAYYPADLLEDPIFMERVENGLQQVLAHSRKTPDLYWVIGAPIKRVGRGNASGKGTTAGKGGKGQTARTGGRNKLKFLGLKRLILSTPKLGGFRSLKPKAAVITLDQLNKAFGAGEKVTPTKLYKKGLVRSAGATVKILGAGELKKKLTVKGCQVSGGAREKIVAAGGEIA